MIFTRTASPSRLAPAQPKETRPGTRRLSWGRGRPEYRRWPGAETLSVWQMYMLLLLASGVVDEYRGVGLAVMPRENCGRWWDECRRTLFKLV